MLITGYGFQPFFRLVRMFEVEQFQVLMLWLLKQCGIFTLSSPIGFEQPMEQ